jgi:hypothetical protein
MLIYTILPEPSVVTLAKALFPRTLVIVAAAPEVVPKIESPVLKFQILELPEVLLRSEVRGAILITV